MDVGNRETGRTNEIGVPNDRHEGPAVIAQCIDVVSIRALSMRDPDIRQAVIVAIEGRQIVRLLLAGGDLEQRLGQTQFASIDFAIAALREGTVGLATVVFDIVPVVALLAAIGNAVAASRAPAANSATSAIAGAAGAAGAAECATAATVTSTTASTDARNDVRRKVVTTRGAPRNREGGAAQEWKSNSTHRA